VGVASTGCLTGVSVSCESDAIQHPSGLVLLLLGHVGAVCNRVRTGRRRVCRASASVCPCYCSSSSRPACPPGLATDQAVVCPDARCFGFAAVNASEVCMERHLPLAPLSPLVLCDPPGPPGHQASQASGNARCWVAGCGACMRVCSMGGFICMLCACCCCCCC
jgi:hypothetical protein